MLPEARNRKLNTMPRYLDTLSKTNRLIFVRRYWYMDTYEYLSRVTGLNTAAVRKRLSRTGNGLKDYLRSKGVEL